MQSCKLKKGAYALIVDLPIDNGLTFNNEMKRYNNTTCVLLSDPKIIDFSGSRIWACNVELDGEYFDIAVKHLVPVEKPFTVFRNIHTLYQGDSNE